MIIKETEKGFLVDKDFYPVIEQLYKFKFITYGLNKIESRIEDLFNTVYSAEQFFEKNVDMMVETLLSIFIFGNKTKWFNHWCDKLAYALNGTLKKHFTNKDDSKVSDFMQLMDESPAFIQYCSSKFSMKEMLKKIETKEGKFLKQREIEQYQKFLFSAFTSIKMKIKQNLIDMDKNVDYYALSYDIESDNIKNALAIYADLDDLYFKENPDVEKPDYEEHQQAYFKFCGKYDESI